MNDTVPIIVFLVFAGLVSMSALNQITEPVNYTQYPVSAEEEMGAGIDNLLIDPFEAERPDGEEVEVNDLLDNKLTVINRGESVEFYNNTKYIISINFATIGVESFQLQSQEKRAIVIRTPGDYTYIIPELRASGIITVE